MNLFQKFKIDTVWNPIYFHKHGWSLGFIGLQLFVLFYHTSGQVDLAGPIANLDDVCIYSWYRCF